MNFLKVGLLITVLGHSRREVFKVASIYQAHGEEWATMVPVKGGVEIAVPAASCWPYDGDDFDTLKSIGARSISEAKEILTQKFLLQFEHREACPFDGLNAVGLYMSKRLVAQGKAWRDDKFKMFTYLPDAWMREIGR